jgi:hypothetical protein
MTSQAKVESRIARIERQAPPHAACHGVPMIHVSWATPSDPDPIFEVPEVVRTCKCGRPHKFIHIVCRWGDPRPTVDEGRPA